MKSSRKELSTDGLIRKVRLQFEKIIPLRKLSPRNDPISLADCLMSAFAMFSLKIPSLLKFDQNFGNSDNDFKYNLRTLYHVDKVPSDTYLRERLDEVNPEQLRGTFKALFSGIQRGGLLKEYQYLDGHYLCSADGTGFFSSPSIHCENCCIKKYGRCHIKILGKRPNDIDDVKKNTYLLTKSNDTAWELVYIDRDKDEIEIPPGAIDGLPALLEGKKLGKLTKAAIKAIKKVIIDYHESIHPELAVEYYHNMFCAAIVHPDKKTVLPFSPPEAIMKSDGSKKNDCERNASKRLFQDMRREHPHLKLIIIEDGLASNVPHLEELGRLNMRYIIGAKPGDHKALFEMVEKIDCNEYTIITENGDEHYFRYINNVQLNDSHPEFFVNFLQYREKKVKGKEQHFSWVTDLIIKDDNVYDIMRGGRARFKIENETYNTLKNQGYHFEHNFGHGNNYLSTIFATLMFLAFFVDQAREMACYLFKKAREEIRAKIYLWEHIEGVFFNFLIDSWDDLYEHLIYRRKRLRPLVNTS